MQELEKILEEIDKIYVDDIGVGVDCNLEGRSDLLCNNCYECIKDACKNIIRKHMNAGERFEFDFTNVKSFDCQCGRHYVNTGAENNDGWIPVEERLPMRTFDEKINESYQKYLVFIDGVDGWDIDIAVYDFWNDKKWREAHDGYGEIENVIAWRPLPEPYRPERI